MRNEPREEGQRAGVAGDRPGPEFEGMLVGDEHTDMVHRHDHHDQAAQRVDRCDA